MTSFADNNVSQSGVATHARCGGIDNIRLTANLPRNLVFKNVLNRLRFDGIMVMSLWPSFLAHPVYIYILLRTSPTALLTDYTAHCQMGYNIVLFTKLYYN